MKIFKYELVENGKVYISNTLEGTREIKGIVSSIEMPKIRKPISVAEQNGKLFVWAEIDDSHKDYGDVDAIFLVIPTGFEVSLADGMVFIGTVHKLDGEVYHIYWHKDWFL